jgi:hypothetical protein
MKGDEPGKQKREDEGTHAYLVEENLGVDDVQSLVWC